MGGAGLREEFLRLLREDEEFRYAVLGLLGIDSVLRSLEELSRAVRDLQQVVAEHTRVLEEHSKAIRGLQEAVAAHSKALEEHSRAIRELQQAVAEHLKVLEHHSRVLEEHAKAIRELAAKVNALGTRWGIVSEETFRESVKYLVEDLVGAYRVERWVWYDRDGFVYGHPSWVEVDVLVRDGEHILVEFKASVDRADVGELYRIGQLYERVVGVRPRLLLVSPAIRRRAAEAARQAGVELRGEVLDV